MNLQASNENRPMKRKALVAVAVAVWTIASLASNIVGIWLAVGSTSLLLGVLALRFDFESCRQLLRPKRRLIVLGVIVGGLMAVATHLMYPVFIGLVPQVTVDIADLYAAFRAPSVWVPILFLGPVILGEELVWRGVVQTELSERFGTGQGVLLAAGFYTLVQVPVGSPVLLLTAFSCGLVWSALRASTRSLVSALVAHILWDVAILLWLPIDVF